MFVYNELQNGWELIMDANWPEMFEFTKRSVTYVTVIVKRNSIHIFDGEKETAMDISFEAINMLEEEIYKLTGLDRWDYLHLYEFMCSIYEAQSEEEVNRTMRDNAMSIIHKWKKQEREDHPDNYKIVEMMDKALAKWYRRQEEMGYVYR